MKVDPRACGVNYSLLFVLGTQVDPPCGVNGDVKQILDKDIGRSPRMRGKLPLALCLWVLSRSIPAHAG